MLKSVQVENEDIKVTALGQDKESSHLEEQGPETNPQGIIGDHNEHKTVDVPDFKEENHEDMVRIIVVNYLIQNFSGYIKFLC